MPPLRDQLKHQTVVILSGHGIMDSNVGHKQRFSSSGMTVHFCTRPGISVYDTQASDIENEILTTGKTRKKTFFESKNILRSTEMRLHYLDYPTGLSLKTPGTLNLGGFVTAEVTIGGVKFKEYKSGAAIGGRSVIQAIVKEDTFLVTFPDVVEHYLTDVGSNDIDFVWAACRAYQSVD